MNHKLIMTAEVKVDCYAGELCDQQRKYFNIFCEGDMQDDDNDAKQLTIKLADLPPGAKVTIGYPCCPNCRIPRENILKICRNGSMRIIGHVDMCECGFNWFEWAENEYS